MTRADLERARGRLRHASVDSAFKSFDVPDLHIHLPDLRLSMAAIEEDGDEADHVAHPTGLVNESSEVFEEEAKEVNNNSSSFAVPVDVHREPEEAEEKAAAVRGRDLSHSASYADLPRTWNPSARKLKSMSTSNLSHLSRDDDYFRLSAFIEGKKNLDRAALLRRPDLLVDLSSVAAAKTVADSELQRVSFDSTKPENLI